MKIFRTNILILYDLKASENVTNFRKKNVVSVNIERVNELFDQFENFNYIWVFFSCHWFFMIKYSIEILDEYFYSYWNIER